MGKQNHYDYFISFEKIAAKGSEIARMLIRSCEEFQQETFPEHLAAMHQLEHEADLMGHEMMHHLARDFITPIERDDLIQLANELDEVIDAIEDVLMRVYMYNVPSILPDAVSFAKTILHCAEILEQSVKEFSQFKKSKTLAGLLIEVNRLEEEGDKHYTEAVRALYSGSSLPPLEVMGWTEIYHRMERCCDNCEHAADVMERVIMNNT